MMKYFKTIGIVLLLAAVLSSCSTAGKLEKANNLYEAGGYYSAVKIYEKISGKVDVEDRPLAVFRQGECYRIMGNLARAEPTYQRLIRNKANTISEAHLRLGEVYLMGKKYDQAIESFRTYKLMVPDDSRADIGIASCEMAKQYQAQEKNKDIVVENFKEANSVYNDYAPAYGTADYEMLLFTSSRSGGKRSKKKQAGTGQRPSAIFSILQGRTGWEKPTVLGTEVNGKKDEDGSPCFNSSFDQLYYTKSTNPFEEKTDGCNIYVAKRDAAYNWADAELLEAPDSIVMAHPSISEDGLTLYFVSNMPGGFGGKDIWKMTRKTLSGVWDNPVNLGSNINTKGDEVFPFIRPNGELYFASNGHPSYGGLDIYKATQEGIEWKVENMGPPFNSEVDDFSIIYEASNNQGYFASRRKGGRGGDDIYRFYKNIPVIEYFFNGVVRDDANGKPIAAAQVTLTGNNGAVLLKNTEGNGTFSFRLTANTDYVYVVSGKGYLNQKGQFSTRGYDKSHKFNDTIQMVSMSRPIEIPNIFYEYASAELNNQSRQALDELVELMNDNPDIVIELAAHTDSRGSDEANMDLSQRRSQAVVNYLISEGISEDRMYAKGYGESQPKVVTRELADQYKFLTVGQKLTEEYINSLRDDEQQEVCHQLNRRTELIVLNTKELERIKR